VHLTYSHAVESAWIVDNKHSENDILGVTYIETRLKENLENTELITVISNGDVQTHTFIPKAKLESETE
jgi:hypothetical protein